MKGFSVQNGDVIVNKTDIEMVDGSELLRQKVELVIGTNKGEWEYDKDEGIDFRVLLCKNPDEDEIRAEIADALTRLDDTFSITEFSMNIADRHANISFKAVNGEGEEVGGSYTYGG